MTPAERRGALRQQRRELRRALVQRRRQAQERVRQDPRVRRAQRRRRVRRLLVVALLLLLASLLRCECQPPPAPEAVQPAAPQPAKVSVPVPPPAKPEEPRLRMEKQPRARMPETERGAPTWLEDFRLQVAARSPRLAACFKGESRPGALRWTTAVNPQSGAVADHVLEPVGTAAEPGQEQRACLLEALSRPPYRLKATAAQSLPTRVGLVLEF